LQTKATAKKRQEETKRILASTRPAYIDDEDYRKSWPWLCSDKISWHELPYL